MRRGGDVKRRELLPGIEWVGAVDWDRRLFDALIPLPEGTSYNAYLVRGRDRTALIDTVDPTKADVLWAHLADVERIDDLVIQHVEQDHSGLAPAVLARYPEVRILATPKAQTMIADHLGIPAERITPMADGDSIALGGRTLRFLHAPWVHWPETMLTYVPEDRVLFTCDLFGSHLAMSGLFAREAEGLEASAKRYYAEIMMPFAKTIRGHLEKVGKLALAMIAPSHGPVHDDPARILSAYDRWVNGGPSNLVLVPYTTMHGSTGKMVEHLMGALGARGVAAIPFNLSVTDLGAYAIHLVDAATVVFATPTVLVGPHPSVVLAAALTAALRPRLRYAAVIGSYGWAGKAPETIQTLAASLAVEWLPSVFARGLPTSEILQALDRLADTIAEKHHALAE
jgi:flavorubredoxin